ncbi:MAG: 50S ribosomal protein L28 [Bacteroidota bacterium]|nr:50S ribosomal protein L28 [Bacteroidota bacterium]
MSRVCDLTGKRAIVGNYVGRTNKRTKRKFYPNLQVKKFYIPEIDRTITLKISTSALRNMNKKGVYNYLMELEKKGIKVL